MLSQLTQVSQSPFAAVTVADVMTHLNIVDTTWETYLQTLIDAAVDLCERETQTDWRQTTWELVCDQFPIWRSYGWYDRYGNQTYSFPWTAEFAIGRTTQRWQQLDLMRGPLNAVTEITYFDENNDEQTLDSDQYQTNKPSFLPATLEPVTYWPICYPRPDAVTITFTTGFNPLPARGIQAVKLLVGTWWVQREDLMYGPNTASGAVGCVVDRLLGTFSTGNYQ